MRYIRIYHILQLLEVSNAALKDLLILFARHIAVQILTDTLAVSHLPRTRPSGEVMPSIAIIEVFGLK